MSGKINKPKPLPAKHIPRPAEIDESKLRIRFSFECLDLRGNDKFSIDRCHKKDGYFEKLLERFKAVNQMTLKEFKILKKELRNHKHEWAKTSEPSGFKINGQLDALEPWQFELTKSEHGRVHGILIQEVFMIVWLDPDHELYP